MSLLPSSSPVMDRLFLVKQQPIVMDKLFLLAISPATPTITETTPI
uniref:Uncharacterized protein n=1 Tax=Amphimedon queenslandica TaxID=400682 RepID=A0A1X7VCB7_AMPQE